MKSELTHLREWKQALVVDNLGYVHSETEELRSGRHIISTKPVLIEWKQTDKTIEPNIW